MAMIIPSNQSLEFVSHIIECFESFLEKRSIKIDNPEKEGDPDASLIYGTDYGELQEGIEYWLVEFNLASYENQIALNAVAEYKKELIKSFKQKGYSNTLIGDILGLNESTVRHILEGENG